MRRIVMAHGGTASTSKEKDGTDRAVEVGMRALKDEGPIAAVVEACAVLEDDERFNAGTGSNYRFDGQTIEMSAAVMDSRDKYGAVSAIQKVKNPVKVAHALMFRPNNILCGIGATRFARAIGHKEHDPGTRKARKEWEELIEEIKKGEDSPHDNEWDYDALRESWNYERPFEDVFGDKRWAPRKNVPSRRRNVETVGAVATDGRTFAAAASTGGTVTTLQGRVGDTPNIGTGLFAGECGAIALTGNGDHILRQRAATMVHEWLARGFSPTQAVRRLPTKYADGTDIWAAVVGLDEHAGGGNRDIAWSVKEE